MSDCTPAHDVYNNLPNVDCLPHTGMSIWTLVFIGVLLLLFGIMLAIYTRRVNK